jgi:diguanylate cyclase (GGDEF)-like protein
VTEPNPQLFYHTLVVEDSQGQREIPLLANTYSLGRATTNSIVIRSQQVSRQHAILLRVPSPGSETYRFRVIDGNLQGTTSTNGLFVNGERCFSHDLQHGDVIEFGRDSQVKASYFLEPGHPATEIFSQPMVETPSRVLSGSQAKSTTTITPMHSFSETAISRMASFPELAPHPIIEINLAGTITYVNPAALKTFPDLPILGSEHRILVGLLKSVQMEAQPFFTRQVEINGHYFEQSVHSLAASDLVRTFITDFTQRKQSELELQKRDRLLQAVASATIVLLANADFEGAIAHVLSILGRSIEVDRAYLYENPASSVTEGMAIRMRHEWTQEGIAPSIHHPYSTFSETHWYQTLAAGLPLSGNTPEFPDPEQEILRRDQIESILQVPIFIGSNFWGFIGFDHCRCARNWSSSEETMLVTMAASISGALQRRQTEAIIRYQAFHDLLTDLPNRSLFSDRLQVALANASRSSSALAVMFLDLDRFKTINDTLGHTLGDRLLQEIAQRLTNCVRKGDTVARWGGDEFTILLSVDGQEEIAAISEVLLTALRMPFELEGHELYITFSIGIAIHSSDDIDAETLIQHADSALYHAKQMGRNTYQFFTPDLSIQAPERLNLEKNLRRALSQEEFLLYYQPQVDINTGKVTGFEALLRWQHPELGLVAPSVFIPVAEETGLILPIGEWALRTACAQNKAWQDQGFSRICMAVNLSARQFYQPNLPSLIAEVLRETGLDSQYLDLEITETTAIQDIEFARSLLQQMQELGVQISMDDFGTGYSSLTHLRKFSINTIKIDQSFVRDLGANSRDLQIVSAVISLARGLNLSVVAEGVETLEQLRILQNLDCAQAQGYLFSRPLSTEDATELLRENVAFLDLASTEV